MRWAVLAWGLIVGLSAEPMKVGGGGQFGQIEIEAIDGAGLIRLNGTTVLNEIHLSGSLISQNGTIGSLDVMGEVNLTGTTIKQGGFIMGSFQASRSIIEKPITILSQRTILTASKLVDIHVKQDSAFKGKQIVELRQNTLVDGPIHFESGRGEVIIYPGSQVLGSVTGGKVIKK